MYDPVFFSRVLKAKRIMKGWSQEDLAGKADLSVGSIARYEQAVNTPAFDAVCKIADALGCSTDEFWQREGGAVTK